MKLLTTIATLILAAALSGCTVGKNPTTQQIVDAQSGNQFIAKSSRLAFERLATDIAAKYPSLSPASQKVVDDAEDAIKEILNEMDQAALGDPNRFAQLSKDAAWRQFVLGVQFGIIDLLTPSTPISVSQSSTVIIDGKSQLVAWSTSFPMQKRMSTTGVDEGSRL